MFDKKKWVRENQDKIKEAGKKYYASAKCKITRGKYLDKYYSQMVENYILNRTRTNAKIKNKEFNLELSDIVIPEYCPVLGIKLNCNGRKGTGQKDDSISVDRIDNSKGYIKGNIQIMSLKANRMKANATFDEIEKLYLYMKAYNGRQEASQPS